jgi:GTP-binding protein EngB required for normal cell division
MRLDRAVRISLVLAIILLALGILLASLYLTERVLSVWEYLVALPRWIMAGWLAVITLVVAGSGYLILRLLLPGSGSRDEDAEDEQELSEQAVRSRLEAADAVGVDTHAAHEELRQLAARRDGAEVYVAFHGEVSAGKSSLIQALLPQAQVEVSVRAGSTREVSHYRWRSPAGDTLVLTDVPGLADADGVLSDVAREESLRAHVVVYVCDGDLTRVQHQELLELLSIGKPLLLALNKADRYTDEELERIGAAILDRLTKEQRRQVELIPVSAGGEEQLIRVSPDGTEIAQTRRRPPLVDALRDAIQQRIDRDRDTVEKLRDASVFLLASRKLSASEAQYRREQSEILIQKYTRRAVVGALAAVAPGTDLVIQGVLGTQLVREMCKLYDAPARDIELDRFLKDAQTHVRREVPLLLAVAGNALKAFPGVGTIAGGLLHAVAYGLIFDALGRALAATLQAGGRLRPVPAAHLFQEVLGDDLEARTRRIARLALELGSSGDGDANGGGRDERK